MDLNQVAYCEIYPSIGIARVGSSPNELFLAPELPDMGPKPDMGKFKDEEGRTKRQGARFRVYGFNNEGEILGEITAEMAHIEWRVHLANIKAAWYRFENAMDLGPNSKSAQHRNPTILGTERDNLVINPGPRIITGKNTSGAAFRFDSGKFFDREIYLGELRTDELGRLIVLGGHGKSFSLSGEKPTTVANNDGWCDDTADGPVRASITIKGRQLEAKPAWVAVTPPNYAPDTWGVVTMYDLLLPIFQKNFGYKKETEIEFWEHIYVIFKRLAQLSGLNFGAYMLFGPGSPFDLNGPDFVKKLSDNSASNETFRQKIFKLFRNPNDTEARFNALPPLYGDAYDDNPGEHNARLSITSLQYEYLNNWANGNFSNTQKVKQTWDKIEDAPLNQQTDLLNRAHLESVLGGPFHPGIELTWTLRRPSMWASAFRLNILAEGQMPLLNYGDTLSPEIALSPSGPFYNNGPGMLTAFLGIPWQTDHASCDAGYQTGLHLPLPSYWGPRAPNQVLAENSYEALKNQKIPKSQRMKHFSHRSQWYRLLRPTYLSRIDDMVKYWDELGIIVNKESPLDYLELGLPSHVLVETELESANGSPVSSQLDESLLILHDIENVGQLSGPELRELKTGVEPIKSKLRRNLKRDEK